MSDIKCPCDECISLAICAHHQIVKCDDLTNYMICGITPKQNYPIYVGRMIIVECYPERIRTVEKLFNKRFGAVYMDKNEIIFHQGRVYYEKDI